MSAKLKDWAVKNLNVAADADDGIVADAVRGALESGKLSGQKLAELTRVEKDNKDDRTNPRDAFGNVRVKAPSEAYSRTKSVGKHVRSGQPVLDERGREVMLPSELECAKAGALLKMLAGRSGMSVSLNEHERALVEECFDDPWVGKIGSQWETGIEGARVKALIGDTLSGGIEVTPAWFDDAVIQFPLLHSEVLPRVDLRDVPRGSNVEGASIGNPTVTWGTPEGTGMSVFDTASLVAEINSTIYPVTCAVEVGRDLMADSPGDVGRVLLENVGQAMLAELDKVIVNGNGTSQPQGIKNASGITDVGNPAGGSGAVPQIDDYEALMFAVGKQYRNPAMRCGFIGTDTTYRRARGIPVGTSDARRLFGMDHGSYQLLEHPFLIENNAGNANHIFGALAKYRLYRRQGQEVRWETGGKELATKNLALLILRGRFGGRVVDANAFAIQTHGKT